MNIRWMRRWSATSRQILSFAAAAVCVGASATPAIAQLTDEDIEALRRQGQKEGWTFTVGHNSATGYDLNALCGGGVSPDWQTNSRFDPCTPKGNLPDYFDWRDQDGCTPIKHQGTCGSCWAFATVGAFESDIRIKSGTTTDLSEQWLVSCTDAGSCVEGYIDLACNYLLCGGNVDPCGDSGAVLETDFPYEEADVSCDCPYGHPYCLDSWSFVGSSYPTVEQIKQAIYDHGPVVVLMNSNPAFQGYTGGVFNACEDQTCDHAVVLVGWDDNQGTDGVWFLRNSWGAGWGESGYARIEYDCSRVGAFALYVEWAGVPETVNIEADADTFVYEGSADTNYGYEQNLAVGDYEYQEMRSLIHWDILSEIPAGSQILSVSLRVRQQCSPYTPNDVPTTIATTTSEWFEYYTTWNYYNPSCNDLFGWTAPGCTNGHEWRDIEDVDGKLRNWIQSISNGSPNYGLAIKSNTSAPSDYVYFSSKEYDGSSMPRLIVEYYVAGDDPPTDPPQNLDPGNTEDCLGTSVCLDWTDVENADWYEVYWGTTNPPAYWDDAGASEVCPPDNPDTVYYWYVIPCNDAGCGPAGPTWSYVTNDVPSAPTNSSPGNGAVDQPLNVCIDWSDVEDAESYDVYWGETDPPPFWENVDTSEACPTHDDGQTYYWYIVANNTCGEGQAGETWGYTIASEAPPGEWRQTHKLVADDGAEGDVFGRTVSICGNTIVVGAWHDDDHGNNSGSAYIFSAASGTELHKLTADDAAPEDWFGASVAASGQITVVGANYDDFAGDASGSAYVFDANSGLQVFEFAAPDTAAEDQFGWSVAVDEDMIAVGAHHDDDGGDGSGSAYIFDAETVQLLHKLVATDAEAGDRFGSSVSICAGIAVVGAHFADCTDVDSGAAYVFDTATAEQKHKFIPDAPAEDDHFGNSVAVDGNIVVVGAPFDDDMGPDAGAAYVYDGLSGERLSKLYASDAEAGDLFGAAVAIDHSVIVIGAKGRDDNGVDSGAAYVFNALTFDQIDKLTASDAAADDAFGQAVSVSNNTIVVGAYQDDDGGSASGSAYVFQRDEEPCPADLNEDDRVDIDDLFIVLAYWGHTEVPADINQDGFVDIDDLFAVLAAWGPCPILPLEMVSIPGGEFAMGRHVGEGGEDELPVHDVYVDPFMMSVFEINNEQYCEFLNSALLQQMIEVGADGVVYKAGDSEAYCDTQPLSEYSRIYWDGVEFTAAAGKGDHPMVQVTWYGSAAYANWRSMHEELDPAFNLESWECDWNASGYRLPTEAEWEFAGRGGEHDPYYRFPWGDDLDGSKANYYESGDPFEEPWPGTSPDGYYNGNQVPPGDDMVNGYGLYDMIGNVWEWCYDWYDEDYYDYSPYDNPNGPDTGDMRVLRGMAWSSLDTNLNTAGRYRKPPDYQYYSTGFRLVRNLP